MRPGAAGRAACSTGSRNGPWPGGISALAGTDFLPHGCRVPAGGCGNSG